MRKYERGADVVNERERIALIERLRALPTETEWLEFKRNQSVLFEKSQHRQYGGVQDKE